MPILGRYWAEHTSGAGKVPSWLSGPPLRAYLLNVYVAPATYAKPGFTPTEEMRLILSGHDAP